jgi:PPK2 family polyphosphate:nucleotide phosphotransferase
VHSDRKEKSMDHKRFIVPSGKKISIGDYDPGDTGTFKEKEDAIKKLQADIGSIASMQDILYAQDRYALLIIFQAMDAAGKDGAIKHVMSGLNPQGCQVQSFKAPSAEELDHDFLWRCVKALPERGTIGIFNRSYFEEVLVVRVHPDILEREKVPVKPNVKDIWKKRYEEINNFEHYLVRNDIIVLKFFLHVSKEEQRRRFLERIEKPEKNWKFSIADASERNHWDEYMEAYREMLQHTSTKWAPWYVIPADHKWFTRVAVADVLLKTLQSLDLTYPSVSKERKTELQKIKRQLEEESEKGSKEL